MAEVRFSIAARTDLADIWDYLVEHGSVLTADRVIRSLHASCRRLAEMPGMGRRRNFPNPEFAGLRSWTVEPYVVFYVPLPDTVEIVRILHGARDIEALFGDP
jgi:toxin ParE1/3/4